MSVELTCKPTLMVIKADIAALEAMIKAPAGGCCFRG